MIYDNNKIKNIQLSNPKKNKKNGRKSFHLRNSSLLRKEK